MTIAEIIQYCALNGISIISRRTNPELVGATFGVLPEGATSVIDLLRIPDMIELVFSMDGDGGRLQWHTVLEPGLVTDAGAFAASMSIAFERFCKVARISPLAPPVRTLFGFPIRQLEEEGFKL
jgi:hypothetical protein